MRETSKCDSLRLADGTYMSYFNGHGIDICPQDNDDLMPGNNRVIHYTRDKESATQMVLYGNSQFDFVYASHVLPELEFPEIAIRNWLRICRPSGYVYVVVPEGNHYLQGQWPCPWNAAHKWNFSLDLPLSFQKNIVVNDWLRQFNDTSTVIKSFTNIVNLDPNRPNGTGDITRPYRIDQTYPYDDNVIINIEFILQKKV